jgi:DNA-binding response OmpR family regulator
VVFLDILIPEQDGWLVCSKMKLHASSPAIVMMTGRHEAHTRRFASFVHADAFLAKPFAAEDALCLLESFAAARKAVS